MVIPLWKTIMSAEETNERRVFVDENNLPLRPHRELADGEGKKKEISRIRKQKTHYKHSGWLFMLS
jgi:hypothetical protein